MDVIELENLATTDQVRQSCWTSRRTWKLNDRKVRTVVRNDAYKFQSNYFVEMLDPNTGTWNTLHIASNDEWHERVDTLFLDRITNTQHQNISLLHNHLLCMAMELLS